MASRRENRFIMTYEKPSARSSLSRVEWQLWIIVGTVIALMIAVSVFAGSPGVDKPISVGLRSTKPARVAIARPLAKRDLSACREGKPSGSELQSREINETNAEIPWRLRRAEAPREFKDPALQRSSRFQRPNMPSPTVGFPGSTNLSGVLPPDPTGAAGERYYVQWINLQIDILDKATGASAIGGPIAGNMLWAPLGGECATNNDGDPTVLYDHLAHRWFLSQITFTNHVCIAVSRGSDPVTSGWYLYDYLADLGAGYFPDAPKFGVWPDGYYMSANMFNGNTYEGSQVAVFERSAMLTGDTGARMLYGFLDYSTYDWAWSLLPADLDGPMPPAGTPGYYVTFYDDAWGGGHSDELWVLDLTIDWGAGSGTIGLNAVVDLTAAGYPFDSNLCGYDRNCIPQPGTSQGLDALASRLMYRLQYRYLNGTPTLVTSHAVDVDGSDHAGIRWYELQDSGGGFGVVQAGSYAPDTDDRWAPSAAMDAAGDMAVGYSISSASTYPSVRWAGRLSSDPADTLGQGEATVVAGAGSQTHTSARWGDYTTMSLDPVDDCTFWYANEYYDVTSSASWKTWIAAFKFSAGTAPTNLSATPSGNNGVTLSWTGVASATGYGVYRGSKPGGPYVRLATTPAGTTSYLDISAEGGQTWYYVVTAFYGGACDSGYSNEASATVGGACDLPPAFRGIVSAIPNGCGIDLSWYPATASCGGTVTYSVYRSTDLHFTPSLSNRIAAGLTGTSYNDRSGLSTGTTYYYIVRATDRSNGQEDGNAVIRHAATSSSPVTVTLFSDGFEGLPLPAGHTWISTDLDGDGNDQWVTSSARQNSGSFSGHFGESGGNYLANQDGRLVAGCDGTTDGCFGGMNGIVLPANATSITLTYYQWYQFRTNSARRDGGFLEYSTTSATSGFAPIPDTDPGTGPFISGTSYDRNLAGASCEPPTAPTDQEVFCANTTTSKSWRKVTVNLSDLAGQTVWLSWRGVTNCSREFEGWYIDDVLVQAVMPGCSSSSVPQDVQFFTARSTSGEIKLEWANPSSGVYGSTKICRDTAVFPDPDTCTPIATQAGVQGAYDSFTDTGLTNGTTYHYTAFVDDGSGNLSGGRRVTARPFDTTGAVKWAYSSGATALAPTGVMPGAIGTGGTWAVSNDRVLHAMNPTAAGGDWPRSGDFSWIPLAMNGPAQARPPVVPTGVIAGHSLVTFLGSEDGHAYAADAHTGQLLWQSSKLGNILLASPSGIFTDFGGAYDLLFIGSRDATDDNVMYMLDPADGHILATFDNGGGTGAMGIISSGATVEYASNRIYFASRSRSGGSSDTLWCLGFTDTGFTKVWSRPYGDIDGAPVLIGGRLYVGNNAGVVYAVDPADGSEIWHYATNDGAVKGYVTPEYTASTPRQLHFATTNTIWALTDNGGSAALAWQQGGVPGPSIPLAPFGENVLYVGSSDGRLYQLSSTTGSIETSVLLGDGTATIGSPALDVFYDVAYAGSESGTVYGVQLPLR